MKKNTFSGFLKLMTFTRNENYSLDVHIILDDECENVSDLTFQGVSDLNVRDLTTISEWIISIESLSQKHWEDVKFFVEEIEGAISFYCCKVLCTTELEL